MKISIVGTGNVAVVLGKLLVKTNHTIVEIYGRKTNALNEISRSLNAKAITSFTNMNTDIDVCLIAVSDDAIEAIAKEIEVHKALIVHTSGATSKEVLHRFENYGVLYPYCTGWLHPQAMK